MRRLVGAVLAGFVTISAANAEQAPMRPMPRPVQQAPQDAAPLPAGVALSQIQRPKPRPELAGSAAAASVPAVAAAAAPLPAAARVFGPSQRPAARPERLASAARERSKAPKPQGASPKLPSAKGSVCQDPAIKGVAVSQITSPTKGCGIEAPVRITEVAGVRLSTPATLDCDAAKALKKWVEQSLQPAFSGDRVVQLQIAAHYVCRPRNRVKGARISEHGKGRAIDISGFKLASGKSLTVLEDYRAKQGAPIRKAHKAACGIFGTTLGPGSDGYHKDHLHLDVARYRGGPYCK